MKFTITFKDLSTEHMGHVLSMLDEHNRKAYPESRRVPLPTVDEHHEPPPVVGADSCAQQAQFYMVFREGGHSPRFKHDTRTMASAEAKRIGRDTGSVTVETIQPYALPNAEEFRTHAAERSTNGVGLWRRTRKGMMPRIVGVRVENGVAWVAGEGDGVSLYRVDVSSPPDERWFPLSSDGSDLRDSIPF